MARLSIVVPIYNASNYLRECLDSIVNQIYEDKELILVNDGSKDNSLSICEEYASKYSYIKIVDKENGGVHTARNAGLEVASSPYVAFVDSDDCMDANHFSLLMENIEKNDSDVAATGYKTEYSSNFKMNEEEKNIVHFTIEGSNACLRAIEDLNHKLEGFVWNKVYRKEAIGLIRFRDDIPICDDLLFNYEFMRSARRACYINAHTYHYRYVADSLSKNSSMERYIRCLRGMKNLCKWCEINAPHCLDDIYKNYIFWNTKSCEHMLNNYDESAFLEIQKNLKECASYISKCKFRIRFLAYKILKSWNVYAFYARAIWKLKEIYRSFS